MRHTLFLSCFAFSATLVANSLTPIPILFEENQGQANSAAKYVSRMGQREMQFGQHVDLGNLRIEFTGAHRAVAIDGEQRLKTKVNYFKGSDPKKWLTGIPAFGAVRYRGVYDGIDVVYHGRKGELEYDFELAPGANAQRIGVRFHGARRVWLSTGGELHVTLDNGEHWIQKKPEAFQQSAGKRVNVDVSFRIEGDVVRFALGKFDRKQPLVIDPVLVYASQLGAYGLANLAVDTAGNSYLTGRAAIGGDIDAVYMKLDAEGKNLLYLTILGGLSADTPLKSVVDTAGNLYAVGTTFSPDFPVNTSPCRSALLSDLFVLKLGPTGAILASRCLGGTDNETAVGIALDASGAVYVAGNTMSVDLPTTPGAFQTTKRGTTVGFSSSSPQSAFAAKMEPAGLALSTLTYLGGYSSTAATDIGVDSSGSIIVAGTTIPSGFPLIAGTYQLPQSVDASSTIAFPFVSKLSPNGGSLVYSTFFSTVFNASQVRVAVDAQGNAVIAYLTPNVIPALRLLKLSTTGTSAVFDRTITGWGYLSSLEMDSAGNLLLTGGNDQVSLTPDMLQDRAGTSVVVRMDAAGANATYASMVPGALSVNDQVARFGPAGSIYLATGIGASGFPVTTGSYTAPVGNSASIFNRIGSVRLIPGNGCSATIDTSFNPVIPQAGATGNIPIVAPANCTWIATQIGSTFPWLTFTGPTYGTGNANLAYTATTLLSGEPGRRTVVSLSGNRFAISQGQPAACTTPQFLPSTVTFGPGGGFSSAGFSLPDACVWNATTDANWITLYQASGAGSGSFFLEAAPNTGSARTATVTVNGQNLLVNQNTCNYFLPSTNPVADQAGVYLLNVNADPGCAWAATTTDVWIKPAADATARAGAGSFTFSVDENNTGAARIGSLVIAGRPVTVTQPALTCPLAASASAATFPGSGGSTSLTVTTGQACAVQVSLNGPGTIVGSGLFTGSANVTLNIPSNTSGLPRAFRATVTTSSGSGKTIQVPLIQDGLNPIAPFTDVALGSTFFNHITLLKDRSISRGCTFDGGRYCPNDAVTRGQMAAFLARAMNLGAISVLPYFDDVPPSHPFYVAIQAIRQRNVTLGCSAAPAKFCPDEPLTRGQMAALIVRAVQATDLFYYSGTPAFSDVPATHPFFRHIQRLRDLGVTLGCGNGNFCPDSTNTRGEMSAFITRAFLSN